MHRSFAYLSSANLIHNAKIIRKLALNSKVIIAVKSNAYGHGIRSVSKILDEEFAIINLKNTKLIDGFGVSSLEEALILKSINIKSEILLMQGLLSKEDLLTGIKNNFSIVFHHFEQIKWLIELIFYDNLNIDNLQIWFKINTGMNRLGFQILNQESNDTLNIDKTNNNSLFDKKNINANNLVDLLNYIDNNLMQNNNAQEAFQILERILNYAKSKKNKIIVMSHFAASDNKLAESNQKQINKFLEFTQNKDCYKSFCNSGGVINFDNMHFDYVRPGIMLYGVDPTSLNIKKNKDNKNIIIKKDLAQLNLKPVLTELGSYVISIQNVKKGEGIGYNHKYIAKKDIIVASIGIGYGDGYKFIINKGFVCINEQNFPIIGSISMDIITIDITKTKNKISIGDKAYLINQNKLNIVYVAKTLKTHVWNLLSNIQNRVKYIWS
ncbi:MAG: alanine racemase [Rickettsiales bacterium]